MAFFKLFHCELLVLMLLVGRGAAFTATPMAVPLLGRKPVCVPAASLLRTSKKSTRDLKDWSRKLVPTLKPQQQHRHEFYTLPLSLTNVATVEANIQKNRVATCTAFLTGWADVTLVTRYKTFATMMTGNTLWLAQAVIDLRWAQVCFYSTVIAAYVAGVAGFRKMDYSLRQQTLRASAILVTALFVASDIIFAVTESKFLPVALLSAAFGVINSVAAEETGTLTFVVTGHMTKLTNMLVDRTKVVPKPAKQRPLTTNEIAAALENMSVMVGFVGGALFGWLLQLQKQPMLQSGMFSIMGALFGMMFYSLDMEKIGGAWWKRKSKKMLQLDNDGEIRLAVEQDMAVQEVPLVPPSLSSTNTTSTTTTS